MRTALSSGGLGDIVYSIPIMRALSVTCIYVKETFYAAPYGSMYSAIKALMESQGFIVKKYPDLPLYTYDPNIKIDYDLDTFRYQKMRGVKHIMVNMRKQFNISLANWKDPWLSIEIDHSAIEQPYNVIHLTERWRGDRRVDWRAVRHSINTKIYFIGFQHEYIDFCARYGDVAWFPCGDIMDMALIIAGAEALYCNQSVSLALAQGMGKKYFLERNPGKTNTLLFTDNENLL